MDVGKQHIPTISEIVYDYGIEVFGSLEGFKKWMQCYIVHLGGRPMDLPIEDILEELVRIDEDNY